MHNQAAQDGRAEALHPNHELARKLARSGLPVFPCREQDAVAGGRDVRAKAPYTHNGFKDATTDLDRIDAWWTGYPGAVVGLPTGSTSGISVIDGDIDRDTGEAVGERQVAELGLALDNAITVRTQSGGVQLLYRHIDGARTSSHKVASHVDTRGEGGYIIAPGSIMGTGAAYRYEGRSLSAALSAGDLPEYPLEAVRKALEAQTETGECHHDSADTNGAHGGSFDGFRFDTGQTEATDAETIDVLRRLLSIAPNSLCREDWVKLAVSLRVAFGNTLKADFVSFSLGYVGATPCTPREAEHVWASSGEANEVTSIAPALALLKQAIGQERFREVWRDVLGKRDEAFDGFTFNDGTEGATASDGVGDWPEPLPRYLRDELPPAPPLPLREVFGTRLSAWVENAAQSKGAPRGFVLVSVLSAVPSVVGNARWVSPWLGWAEPPVLWSMCIGLPSAGKSPAIDAAIAPLKRAEKLMRQRAEQDMAEWSERSEVAKLIEATWKDTVKTALKKGETPPPRPEAADPGEPPHLPRLVVNDGTIERFANIVSRQPRGTLQMRDELAGWLEGMSRYSNGSDRPFWLEAYGGRSFAVERVGRDPVSVDHLSISVLGGIQPDRLRSLLLKADDDGLVARFLPCWPEPAPVNRPTAPLDEALMDDAVGKLLSLDMVSGEDGELRPWFVPFTDEARDLMDQFRQSVREWETGAEGLMLSFIGKFPGLAARLALAIALLDYAVEGEEEPREITVSHFGRAAHLIETYFLPMGLRAFAAASMSKDEVAARKLVALIREQQWETFTSRDVMRLDRSHLGTRKDLDPALKLLVEGACIRPVELPPRQHGGRPQRLFEVNPAILEGSQ